MGICISVESNDVYEPTANVILMDGGIQKFSDPVKVEEILKNNPGHFICSSDVLYIGKFITELLPHEELQLGQLYFIVPRRKLGFVLCEKDMASLLLKANNATAQFLSSKFGGKVHPLFNMHPYSGEEEECSSPSSPSYSSSLCCVKRVRSGISKEWKSNLETIVEVA
ncbi:hypothetical protein SUGI_0940920 [Cryptomeria japonica]|uniref:uncharacterized protein LOC131058278 n=1 Tax=Cryptomeria japonica TaxID=3369 RepID=UPI0024147137|nr:uncharacterized protein LOC131058278 [Cryptomeria japonica]GLJ44746.1 hypothetical protein SUGI_0940920 [Cryptomeria japonica]